MASNIEDMGDHKKVMGEHAHRDRYEYVKTWIISRLKSQGFNIHTNYPILGEGRVSHIFDIVAEFTPIPGSLIRIGFILIKDNIDLDIAEKYIAWKSELPLDKIVIIALGSVDSEAFELAKRYSIDIVRPIEDLNIDKSIWNREKFYDEYHIEPVVGLEQALKIFSKKTNKTSILRRSRSRITHYALVFVPLIVLDIHIAEKDIVREEVSVVEGKLVFDGLEGYAVVKEGFSIGLDEILGRFSDFSTEAITVLKKISEEGTVTITDIEEGLGISKEKLHAILGRLSNKSLLDIFGDMVEVRYSILSKFIDPLTIARVKNALIHHGSPTESKGRIVLPLRTCITRFVDLVEALNGKVENIYIVYYPFYVAIKSENGEKTSKLLILDGIALEEKNSFYKIFSNLDILEKIKEKGLIP